MVGDRLDTDIAGGRAAGFATALVLTGVHGLDDALAAEPASRPDRILLTLADLWDSPTRTDAETATRGLHDAWAALDATDGAEGGGRSAALGALVGEVVPSRAVNGFVSGVAGTVWLMQEQQAAEGRAAVEDLDDLTAAVARLEASAEALDARLVPVATAPGAGRA